MRLKHKYAFWLIQISIQWTFSALFSVIALTSYDIMDSIQEADRLQAEGRIREAIDIYEKIIDDISEKDIKNVVLFGMARCYSQIGEDDSAIQTYMRVISDDPGGMNSSNAVSLMMNIYAQRYRFDEMIAMARQIVQQFPGTESAAMSIYHMASHYYSKGESKSAIKEYENLLNQFSKSTIRLSAINRLVYLYIDEGMYQEAENRILDLLMNDQNNSYMLHQLALVYRKQGKYSEALNLYMKIKAMEPQSVEIHEQIGEVYLEQGDTGKALKEWYMITELSSRQYAHHQMLAGILKSHGFYEKAVEEYQKAIKLQPDFAYLYKQLAELYIINKQFDLAADVYLSTLTRMPIDNPDRSEITRNLLEICSVTTIRNNVISKLNSDLLKYPGNVSAIITLADLYFYEGSYRSSLGQFQILASVQQDDGSILLDRANILRRDQKKESAIDFYRMIQFLFPNGRLFSQSLLYTAQIESEIGHPEEAISYLQRLALQNKKLNNDNYEILEGLILMGDIYFNQMHDINSALATYLKARDILADSRAVDGNQLPGIYLKIVECYILMEEHGLAEETIDSIPFATQSKQIKAQIAKLRGDSYFIQGDFRKAEELYRISIKGNLDESWTNDALENMALIGEYLDQGLDQLLATHAKATRLKRSGQYGKALEIYKSAGNSIIDFRLNIGELQELQGDYIGAILTYEELIKAHNKLAPEALFRVAEIYWHKLKDYRRSIESYTRIIGEYPNSILVSDARKYLRILSLEDTSRGESLP